jgi:hypothetical protein
MRNSRPAVPGTAFSGGSYTEAAAKLSRFLVLISS